MKFYRGAAHAARNYVEADRTRADEYYLAEGTGIASRYVADVHTNELSDTSEVAVTAAQPMDGDTYEQWVAGFDVTTGLAKGRLRTDERALRFVEVVVNGPKTWSLAAALHPEVGAAYDAAQERAAVEIITWLAEHSTTRVGPRGRQVQVPVSQLDAALVRHYTSRAGDPHRHIHLQINARVLADGAWRGLHSVGTVRSIEAINGIGHAAVMCDPEFRAVLAAHGYSLDASSEVRELAPYAGKFSARAEQIARNVDRYEADWRRDHPGHEPGPNLRRSWDRRAWAEARPHKATPTDGHDIAAAWIDELHDLGFREPPRQPAEASRPASASIGRINRDAVTRLALSRLGAQGSAWNAADVRGQVENILATVGVITDPAVRRELAEDLTARTVAACTRLVAGDDVPEHVRHLTSEKVLEVEADLVGRLVTRAATPGAPDEIAADVAGEYPVGAASIRLDDAQQHVVAALAGTSPLVVIEGAAGAGKTTTLTVAQQALHLRGHELVVVTPTKKAAQVAAAELGAPAFSAAWLVHQHGFRWDADGRWARHDVDPSRIHLDARLIAGDVLLVDEAGMLDQDTARALFTVADEASARIALVGDRHQLPAVGRGGVLDHAARWVHPDNHLTLEAVHRFTDPDYADLSLQMRTGARPGTVFDTLVQRGDVVAHATDVERQAALAQIAAASPGDLVIADTREHVASLNATIRDQQPATRPTDRAVVTTAAGAQIAVGDRVATRRNDRDLDVANRDQWHVTAIAQSGGVTVSGRRGTRTLPREYATAHVELAYATTVHGAQGETVDRAHFALGETTTASSAYVAMTRGRHGNTAHLVAETLDDARAQWIETFTRDRADLGPAHAREAALEEIEQYGPIDPPRRRPRPEDLQRTRPALGRGSGIGR
ncbi:MobF family relaxase [Nocardioides sp. C4-1]|uniref:MobF family relaxase n=1 Tax=Nocardioides sp. C4-1 TaxID=3151851 RepID=UPI00326412CA